ncbi:type VII secretion protein EccE [Mycobacteroides abscessus]|uniref:type VII secretion protein EccE n=1 Tax=Mycobacteroides abscessus TaxID=36809 RepID=UPI0009A59B72|nr:type VII secretion protein EccE [Mycobacteroides abscessus]SLC86739.1 type VII secretion protein EccE [Mycobacteroides abscessus subsp. abscessus]SLG75460.1 type VII secretion protein EccE [Mycobacteroides abscessus subsp. abscessus]
MRARTVTVSAPVGVVVAAEVVVLGLLLVLAALGVPVGWPVIAGLVLVAAVLAVVRIYRDTLLGWVPVLWRSRRRPDVAGRVPLATDVRRGDLVFGVQRDNEFATAVVEICGEPYAPTVLSAPGVSTTPNVVPVQVLAGELTQPGPLVLAGIDIVSDGARVRRAPGYPPVYSTSLKDSPAAAKRKTYAVVRLDIAASIQGLRLRPTVEDAVAAVAERLICALRQVNCRAEPLAAEAVDALVGKLGGAVLTGEASTRLRHIEHAGTFWSCYSYSAEDITSRNLNDVWSWRVDAAVTSVILRPGPEGAVLVSALVRTETPQAAALAPTVYLNPLPGYQVPAAMSVVPGAPRLAGLPTADLAAVGDLFIPVGPSGILVGALREADGRSLPVLLPMFDPARSTRIRVLDTHMPLVWQYLLRMAAGDHPVSVYTDTPQRWAGLSDPLIEIHHSRNATPKLVPTIVVKDRADGWPQASAPTILSLETDGSYPKRLTPDLKITQPDSRHVTITKAGLKGFEVTLSTLTFNDETPYLQAAR